MFRGATKITLDAKGRLAMPTKYRDAIASSCSNQLVTTVDRDRCLLIYPFPEWENIERKIDGLPSFNKGARQLQRLMIGYATEMELDAHGRILIPKELREFAGIERTAMLVGQRRKFELWDKSRWDETCGDFTSEDNLGDSAELESLSI